MPAPKAFQPNWDYMIPGSYGSFESPSGTVHYLQTKARIGIDGDIGPARTLSDLLLPAREVLSIKDLTFGQLLQRDLDDARVADKLIPYLFGEQEGGGQGPSFFPPVTAVLLPFEGQMPLDDFTTGLTEDDVSVEGLAAKVSRRGDAWSATRYLETDYAELRWRKALARLVVLDGQHRAMAFLATNRTLSSTWQDNPYQLFYDERVKSLQQLHGVAEVLKAELPVTLAWFTQVPNQQQAARKLFVDLNQNARAVSPARVLLLGEGDFVASAVRRTLDGIKAGSDAALAAVEYDYPKEDLAGPIRWSAVTNINILQHAVRIFLTAQAPVLEDLSKAPQRRGTRPHPGTEDANLRGRMLLGLTYAGEFTKDGLTFRRDAIGRYSVPEALHRELDDRFWVLFGEPMSQLLLETAYSRAHVHALGELEASWAPGGDALDGLIKRAVFEGAGVFWSLEDAPDIDADDVLTKHEANFEAARAKDLGLSESDARLVFRRWRLVATQIGLLLLWAYVVEWTGWEEDDEDESAEDFSTVLAKRRELTSAFLEGLDAALAEHPMFIATAHIPEGLELNSARQFRCRFVELLNTPVCLERLPEDLRGTLEEALPDAREVVLVQWTKQRAKVLKEADPTQDADQREERAWEQAAQSYLQELRMLLSYGEDELRELAHELEVDLPPAPKPGTDPTGALIALLLGDGDVSDEDEDEDEGLEH